MVSILWINGLAGSGKSTIAHTIALWCDRAELLGASFFCARTGGRSDVQLIFPTIAYQLSLLDTVFAEELAKALARHPDIHQSLPSEQVEKLIAEPLRAASAAGSTSLRGRVVVIDALDECSDDAVVSVILTALSQFVEDLRTLKFIITSRPEARIVKGFRQYGTLRKNTHPFPLNEIPKEMTLRDIATYVDVQLDEIRRMYEENEAWPGPKERAQLKALGSDSFIVIATALKFIADPNASNPRLQLQIVLAMVETEEDLPMAPLDKLYLGVLDAAILATVKKATMLNVQSVVGTVILLRDQLSTESLDSLLDLPDGTSKRTIEMLGSVIALPKSEGGVIQIIHPSFPDFLVDPSRCTRADILVQPKHRHIVLAKRCLVTMMKTLRRNICGVSGDKTSRLNQEIPDLPVLLHARLPVHTRYALRHWAHHLLNVEIDTETLDLVKTFIQKHLLHWLEALSLIGETEISFNILKVARRALAVRHHMQLGVS